MTRALPLLALAACTLTHPLDKYGAGEPVDAAPEPESDAAEASVDDAGCVGDPVILEPTPNATVGESIHLRVSAPSCIATMIAYLNSKDVIHQSGHAIDTTVAVPIGTSTLNVNGWAGTAKAHTSPIITIVRKN
jgi:hypothetical protein